MRSAFIFLLVRAAVLTRCMLPLTSRHIGVSNIYEHVYTSCFVLVQVKDWPACKRWTRKYLRNAYGGRPAVVANYDMAFADYDAYCRGSRDDMPLYLFDSDFAAKAPLLAGDYTVRSRRGARSRPMAWHLLHRVRHDGCSGTACSYIVQEDPLYRHCQPNYIMHALSIINTVVAGGPCVLEELFQKNLFQAAGPSRNPAMYAEY